MQSFSLFSALFFCYIRLLHSLLSYHHCVSFAYQTTSSTECRLSSTCYDFGVMEVNSGWNTYVKRDEDDDEDEDVCPFLPYAQAEVCFVSYVCQ